MNPILLAAVVAPLLYATVNYVDKFIVGKVATSKSAWSFFGLFSFIIAGIIVGGLAIVGTSIQLPAHNALMLMVTGIFQVSWVYLYFKALEGEDTSSVTPLFQFIGFFAYIFGVLFLGEVLAAPKLLALALILVGGGLLSYDPGKKLAFKKEAGYMLLASAIIALGLVFFKKSTTDIASFDTIGLTEFFISSFWMYLGMGVTTVLVLVCAPSVRNDLSVMLKKNSATVWKANILNEVLNVLATLSVSYALLKIPVATVSALQSVQAFYVLLIGIFGTMFLPKYISETFTKKSIIYKVIAIGIMVAGGILLEVL
ncbi:MAG: EamA family transporter [Candidatus Pacebacteria bacterium]|nr:EamA family transporter [Candidatus Paceibacterota bacterium]MBP9851759.1 EamA family transporter [Candidatus Paceibacterota bacterium]